MNKKHFTDMVKNTIEVCSYNFFLVKQDFSKKCTCVNHTTGEPDYKCKKCLGTGYKVTITKCRGACNDELKGGSTLATKTSRVVRNYFIDCKYPIEDNNLIIDRDKIFYVYRSESMKGVYDMDTHNEVTAIFKKNGQVDILNNFYDIINKKLSAKQKEDFPWLH